MNDVEIIQRLNSLIKAKGLTTKELAINCELTEVVIRNIISGRTLCTLKQAAKIANAVNCSLNLDNELSDFIHIYDEGGECWCVDRIVDGKTVRIESIQYDNFNSCDLASIFIKSFTPYLFGGINVKIDVFKNWIIAIGDK